VISQLKPPNFLPNGNQNTIDGFSIAMFEKSAWDFS
jgi:hypothetical protein